MWPSGPLGFFFLTIGFDVLGLLLAHLYNVLRFCVGNFLSSLCVPRHSYARCTKLVRADTQMYNIQKSPGTCNRKLENGIETFKFHIIFDKRTN